MRSYLVNNFRLIHDELIKMTKTERLSGEAGAGN
jgi:hypothetical protein